MEIHELEQFGANIIERTTEISKKMDGVLGTYPIEFRGTTEKLPVISVRIGFPVYRLANGRTNTLQAEYLVMHPDLPDDFFSRDNDAAGAQKAQHELLGKVIEDQQLLKSFKVEEHQVQPLICTNTGVVVNGNRRLCAWRTLYLMDKTKYKHFQNIEIAVLPECDEQEILDLEERLQIMPEKRAEYAWHAKAAMAQRRLQHIQPREVAKRNGMSVNKLNVLIEAKEYAERYLSAIGKPDHWSLVDKDMHAFEKLVKNSKKFEDNQGDRELFETLVFSMIEQGSDSGRLYDVIDDVADNFDALKADLVSKNNIEVTDEENDETLDLLAGEHVEEDVGSKIADVIRSTDENGQREIIKQAQNVIENEKAIQSEIEASSYLIKQVAKASSLLKAGVDHGMKENADTNGIQEQLDIIKQSITRIEEWLGTE